MPDKRVPLRGDRYAKIDRSDSIIPECDSDTGSAGKGNELKVAIVHEWFVTYAGSERVVEQLLKVVPEAELFALVDFLAPENRGFIGNRHVTTSFIQNLPKAKKKFRRYLPLMPMAVEQLDVTGYDVVLSSNHAVAKGVIIGPDQRHICYMHSPMRYAWDLQHQYLAEEGLTGLKGIAARMILHYMRLWDQSASNRVNTFVANSKYIARRIQNCYHREAQVIYPPVDVDSFPLCEAKENFYLAASRLVPYKRMPLIAEAFSAMPDRKLVMIGDGTDMARVKAVAGKNVEVLGYQSDAVMRDLMRRAKAFVFAAEEDFGITPVEAMACGTPVIAFGRGGATESVVDGQTGLFFKQQSITDIKEAVDRFEKLSESFVPAVIRQRAEFFRPERFRAEFAALLS
jgi:glycosyltransferase involved in cell wall biosynthesis